MWAVSDDEGVGVGGRNMVVYSLNVLILPLLPLLFIWIPYTVTVTVFCFTLMQLNTVVLKAGIEEPLHQFNKNGDCSDQFGFRDYPWNLCF